MINGISGHMVPNAFPFAAIFNRIGVQENLPPCLLAAIKFNETGLGTNPDVLQDGSDASGVMPDGSNAGRGIMQLTSSWPPAWRDPEANIRYAAQQFVEPALVFWRGEESGDDLARCIFASYNAGLGAAIDGHDLGDVDTYTTNHYAARALAAMQALVAGEVPE